MREESKVSCFTGPREKKVWFHRMRFMYERMATAKLIITTRNPFGTVWRTMAAAGGFLDLAALGSSLRLPSW